MMEGIIYKVLPYLEHARLLFIYSKVGKKTLIAQGVQKINSPYRILAQYLTEIEFKDSNKSMFSLSEAKIINDFQIIKNDFNQTKAAAIILEMIDQLVVDNASHDIIYLEAKKALSATLIKESSLSFALKLLKILGHGLDLLPNGKKVIGLNIDQGGLIYEGNQEIIDLDIKSTIMVLKLQVSKYEDLLPIEIEMLDKIKYFIYKYVLFHLQTTLKNLQ
jgi:DNA repair protein RecO (recombination protein O)